jgi:hypothetical protein
MRLVDARAAHGMACASAVILLARALSSATPVASPDATQSPSLDRVLARASDYVVDYGHELASVLAEERYAQRLVLRSSSTMLQSRQLQSEIAFVRLPDSTEWLSFRNVTAVDGVPVPEADGRLARVFQESSNTLLARAHAIAGESARYNLGPITREINVPTTALHVLHPAHKAGCRFDKEGEEAVAGERAWVVRFRERDRGGLITRGDGRHLPAEGRLWLVPGDGRVLKSELVVKNFVRERGGDSKATIRVSWRRDAGLDLWVPDEMAEVYEGPWRTMTKPGGSERYDIEGTATYSNYRRFTVDVRIR